MNHTVLERHASPAAPVPRNATAVHTEAPAEPLGRWETLLLRIARRADELVRAREPQAGKVPDRWFWIKAERDVLGPGSLVGAFNLLAVCSRFSRPSAP